MTGIPDPTERNHGLLRLRCFYYSWHARRPPVQEEEAQINSSRSSSEGMNKLIRGDFGGKLFIIPLPPAVAPQ